MLILAEHRPKQLHQWYHLQLHYLDFGKVQLIAWRQDVEFPFFRGWLRHHW